MGTLIFTSSMSDKLVRIAFHQSVLKSFHLSTDSLVIDELGLKNGELRADIAVLKKNMIGYEIKTDKDNLMRLLSQMVGYNEVFDKVYIITGSKHFTKVVN